VGGHAGPGQGQGTVGEVTAKVEQMNLNGEKATN